MRARNLSGKSPNFTINENDVEGEFFYDAYLSKDINFFGGEGEVFTSIKNIFDKIQT